MSRWQTVANAAVIILVTVMVAAFCTGLALSFWSAVQQGRI